MLQSSDITQPGRFRYYELGTERPQWVDVVRSGEQLVVRFEDMQPGDEDAVLLQDVVGYFEPA